MPKPRRSYCCQTVHVTIWPFCGKKALSTSESLPKMFRCIILAHTGRFLSCDNLDKEGNAFDSEWWEAHLPRQICVDIAYLNLLFVILFCFIYQLLLQIKDSDFTNVYHKYNIKYNFLGSAVSNLYFTPFSILNWDYWRLGMFILNCYIMQMKQRGPDCGSEFTNASEKVKMIKHQFCLTSKKPLSVLPPKKEEGKGIEESALCSINPSWIFHCGLAYPHALWGGCV